MGRLGVNCIVINFFMCEDAYHTTWLNEDGMLRAHFQARHHIYNGPRNLVLSSRSSTARSIMILAASLSTILLLASGLSISITASPVDVRNSTITITISRRLNTFNGTMNILEHDEARVAALKGLPASSLDRRDGTMVILNAAIIYVATVGIGSPPSDCKLNLERKIAAANELSYADQLVVDTAGAVTWIGASKRYLETRTSVYLGQLMQVPYKARTVSGYEYSDTVTLGDGLVIPQQAICASSRDPNVFGLDGILGLGPVGFTSGTLQNAPTTTIPTVTGNLYTLGAIPQEVIGIFFLPSISNSRTYGGITFGRTDATGADANPTNEHLTITPAQYDALQPLNFHVGDV